MPVSHKHLGEVEINKNILMVCLLGWILYDLSILALDLLRSSYPFSNLCHDNKQQREASKFTRIIGGKVDTIGHLLQSQYCGILMF